MPNATKFHVFQVDSVSYETTSGKELRIGEGCDGSSHARAAIVYGTGDDGGKCAAMWVMRGPSCDGNCGRREASPFFCA